MQFYPPELKRYLRKTSIEASICAQRCACCCQGLNIWKGQNPRLAKTWIDPVWRCFRNLYSWPVVFSSGANPHFSISAHVKLEIIATSTITLNSHAERARRVQECLCFSQISEILTRFVHNAGGEALILTLCESELKFRVKFGLYFCTLCATLRRTLRALHALRSKTTFHT